MSQVNIDSSTTPFWVTGIPLHEFGKVYAGVRDLSQLDARHWPVISSRIKQVFVCAPHLQSDRKLKPKGLHLKMTAHTHKFATEKGELTCSEYFRLRVTTHTFPPNKTLLTIGFSTQRYSSILISPWSFADKACSRWSSCLLHQESATRVSIFLRIINKIHLTLPIELLQGKETADFIRFSCAPPALRRFHIEEALRKLNWHTKPLLSSHGLAISPKFMQVPALVLPDVSFPLESASIPSHFL